MIRFVRFRYLSHMQSHLFNIHVQLSSGASGLHNGLSLHLKVLRKFVTLFIIEFRII